VVGGSISMGGFRQGTMAFLSGQNAHEQVGIWLGDGLER